MFSEEIEVVMPNLKVVTPNPEVEGMEKEVGRELSHALKDLATRENWHVHRHNRVYVFNMPLIL